MRATDRNALAVGVAVLLAAMTLTPLTQDFSYLRLALVGIALLTALTVALRRAGFGPWMVVAAQLVGLAVGSALAGLALPGTGGPAGTRLFSLWSGGLLHIETQAAPMQPHPGVTLIFVTAVAGVWLLTDLLVSTLDRPALSVVPLAAVFSVAAVGLGLDAGVGSFLCVALGYLAILLADGLNRTARWTRGLSRDSAGDTRGSGGRTVVTRAAGFLAVPALVASVLLGAGLPTLALSGFGSGSGTGSGPLQLTDPTLDLKRNLTQPADREVLRYQTDQPGGVYLRLTSLTELSAQGFGNVSIELSDGNRLPDPPGLTEEAGAIRRTTIQMGDFGSQYLPMPYAPRSFAAEGDWNYDPNSLTVVNNSERPDALRNLGYSVDSVDIAPDPAVLDRAAAGTPADAAVTAVLPRDFPQSLVALAQDVTADAETPAQRAAAIQAYLRSDRFTYDTRPLPGSGYQALENFLLRDRRGYCEQFAAGMAVLARASGIPTRVAVGFLPGERDGDSWRVTIRNMHAWPELYFAGYGWVRFEPTPSTVTGRAPSWTVATDTSAGQPSAAPSSAAPSASESANAAPSAAPTEQVTGPTADGTAFPWARTLVGTGAGLLALVVLAAPATVRVRRRSTRLAGVGSPQEQVEAAWAEIRDTLVDHGGVWPSGSPRTIGNELRRQVDREHAGAVTQVVTLVEQARYAPDLPPDSTAGLVATTRTIRTGIADTRSTRAKLLAAVAPRSLLRRR